MIVDRPYWKNPTPLPDPLDIENLGYSVLGIASPEIRLLGFDTTVPIAMVCKWWFASFFTEVLKDELHGTAEVDRIYCHNVMSFDGEYSYPVAWRVVPTECPKQTASLIAKLLNLCSYQQYCSLMVSVPMDWFADLEIACRNVPVSLAWAADDNRIAPSVAIRYGALCEIPPESSVSLTDSPHEDEEKEGESEHLFSSKADI